MAKKKKKQKLEGFDNIRQAAFDSEQRNTDWCKCKRPDPTISNRGWCYCGKPINKYK